MKMDRFEDLMTEDGAHAIQSHRQGNIRADSSTGGVLVEVHHASLALKDQAAPANPGCIREFPALPGSFLIGAVVESADPAYRAGDRVVQTGWDLGERHGAGYGRYACVKSDWGIGNFYADDPLPLST